MKQVLRLLGEEIACVMQMNADIVSLQRVWTSVCDCEHIGVGWSFCGGEVASQSSYGGASMHVWARCKARLDVRLWQVLIIGL